MTTEHETWEIDGPIDVGTWSYIAICLAGYPDGDGADQVALVLDLGDGLGAARARLIAAAPGLLEACRSACRVLVHARGIKWQEEVAKLDAAIAKVEGTEDPVPHEICSAMMAEELDNPKV